MTGWVGVRKKRSKANGFTATVIIRLTKNHFISRRADGMLWNGMNPAFGVVFRRHDADRCVCLGFFVRLYREKKV